MTEDSKIFRSGYVTIIGKPNVGKSTLLNTLLEAKISAVTSKPQTTRKNVVAIYNGQESQIIFLDTPGIFEPDYELQRIMVKTAMKTIVDSDIILYMIDVEQRELDNYVLETIEKVKKAVFLIINKIDKINKNELLPIIDKKKQIFPFKEIIPVSALKKLNTNDIIKALKLYLPESTPLYPREYISSQPERFFVSETIKEQIFLLYGDEIPYSTAVYIEEFRETNGSKKDYIRAILMVERDSQKKIIIGKKGRAIKELGIESRKKIENFLNRPIFLDIFVKTRKKWRKNPNILRTMGYI
jgi:GTP-binding protein Era